MVFLNQAGTSWPKPEPVRAAVSALLESSPESWEQRWLADAATLSRAFGITDRSRLLLTPGCTSALSVAVSDHDWRPGDRVLVSSLEHHALFGPVTRLAARGVSVTVLRRSAEASLDLEQLEQELRRGGVRLLAVTAACNVTGELLPVPAIVALAHAHGALCLVDAAQVAGWLPLDVVALGVDLLAFAGHKALQGPWGVGGLYVAPGVAMSAPASACELPAEGGAVACASLPGACDVGSLDRAALAGLAAGIEWLAAPERRDRLARGRARIARLARGLEGCPGLRFHGPRDVERRLPTLALTVDGKDPVELAGLLARAGVIAASGLQCAPLAHEALGTAPRGVLRLSVGPANDDGDIERALEALLAVVR